MAAKEESKPKPKEMSDKITLSVLTKFIKPYNGDRETLPAFLTNCENAMSLATPEQQTVLCKFIISQLEGKAQVACSLKSFTSWPEFKSFLKATFGEKKHATHLLSDLQHCKQSLDEDVTKFSLRVESILTRIQSDIHYSCKNDKELPGRIAAMEDLALNTFMLGLNPSISTIVRCKNPSHLNEAIQYAIDEEKLYNLSKSNAKTSKQCSTCNKPGHSSSECFKNKRRDRDSKIYSNSPSSSTSTNFNNYPKTCNYCKNIGHTIKECRKLQYNMKQRQAADNAQRDRNSAPANSNDALTHTCDAIINDDDNLN